MDCARNAFQYQAGIQRVLLRSPKSALASQHRTLPSVRVYPRRSRRPIIFRSAASFYADLAQRQSGAFYDAGPCSTHGIRTIQRGVKLPLDTLHSREKTAKVLANTLTAITSTEGRNKIGADVANYTRETYAGRAEVP